jgi:hypothetical protein
LWRCLYRHCIPRSWRVGLLCSLTLTLSLSKSCLVTFDDNSKQVPVSGNYLVPALNRQVIQRIEATPVYVERLVANGVDSTALLTADAALTTCENERAVYPADRTRYLKFSVPNFYIDATGAEAPPPAPSRSRG